jgi:hypothetical protein
MYVYIFYFVSCVSPRNSSVSCMLLYVVTDIVVLVSDGLKLSKNKGIKIFLILIKLNVILRKKEHRGELQIDVV